MPIRFLELSYVRLSKNNVNNIKGGKATQCVILPNDTMILDVFILIIYYLVHS